MSNTCFDTDTLKLRRLQAEDFDRGFLELLGQLTTVGDISNEKFTSTFNSLPNTSHVYVFEDVGSNKVVATASLHIIQHFIRSCGQTGHIEDVVVSKDYRGGRLGLKLIKHLVALAKSLGAYKVMLDCKKENVGFYEKCSMKDSGVQMTKYL
ncbi:hypothetical protein P9112_008066 [Eukaryota sp. TZLM1-RC]